MGILHPSAKSRLIEELEKALPNLSVKNGCFFDYMPTFLALYDLNRILPSTGKNNDLLDDLFGERPVTAFCMGYISRKLREKCKFEIEDNPKPITAIADFADAAALASEVIDAFDSLPYNYRCIVALPKQLNSIIPEVDTSVKLGQGFRISSGNIITEAGCPTTSEHEWVVSDAGGPHGILIRKELDWREGFYLDIDLQGFIPLYGADAAKYHVLSKLKAFFGLSLALKLFDLDRVRIASPQTHRWIYFNIKDNIELGGGFELDDDDNQMLSALKVWDRWPSDYPEPSKPKWINKVFNFVANVFQSEHNSNILLASQWYYDSLKPSDDVLRYVRLMTAMEILLGDQTDSRTSSLGELIGNRMSYFIASSAKERSDIIREFKDIYQIRSKILHRGKYRLTGREGSSLVKLDSICNRVLRKEAEFIAGKPLS